jgi:pimeloyl-ACP methyl ester carboxylesterase
MHLNLIRPVGWRLLIAVAFISVLCVNAQSRVSPPQAISPSMRDALVDVGGYRLHFRVIDGRSPTIVLESGGGADSSQWSSLQPELARVTGLAVVSYDRAGFGESDLPSSPYNAFGEVAGLRKGLERLGLAKAVLLVGHSYGGLLNQLYAHKYPKSVKGIVLIDPNTVAFVDAIGGPRQLMEIPFPTTPPLSKLQQAGIRQITSFDKTVELVRKAALPRNIPVTVITAGKPWWPTQKQSEAYRAGHEAIAGGAPNRALVVAEGSGHNIPGERPDTVISAIEGLIRKLQHKRP